MRTLAPLLGSSLTTISSPPIFADHLASRHVERLRTYPPVQIPPHPSVLVVERAHILTVSFFRVLAASLTSPSPTSLRGASSSSSTTTSCPRPQRTSVSSRRASTASATRARASTVSSPNSCSRAATSRVTTAPVASPSTARSSPVRRNHFSAHMSCAMRLAR